METQYTIEWFNQNIVKSYKTKYEFNYQNKSWNENESSKNYQQYYHENVGEL